MAPAEPLTQFSALSTELEAIFARAPQATHPRELAALSGQAELLLGQLPHQKRLISEEFAAVDERLRQGRWSCQQPEAWECQRQELETRLRACEAALAKIELMRGRLASDLSTLRKRYCEAGQRNGRRPRLLFVH